MDDESRQRRAQEQWEKDGGKSYEAVKPASGIAWKPIAEMPDALKDGRGVLLWDEVSAYVAEWMEGAWRIHDWIEIYEPTHYAEINPPENTEA